VVLLLSTHTEYSTTVKLALNCRRDVSPAVACLRERASHAFL